MIQNWKFQRGDIFFTRFDNAIGSEQSGNRPAVVLQNDVGNFYSPTLIVATLTSKAAKKHFDIPVSIDTYKGKVTLAALQAGADLVNDIWGFKHDPEVAAYTAKYNAACCLMHNRNEAVYDDFQKDFIRDMQECIAIAKKANVPDDKIMLDPGVGFGKTYEMNLEIINHLEIMKQLNYPVLLGTSRKSVIGLTLDLPADERVEGTLATTVIGVMKGCSFVRVHDVKENYRIIKMTEAILSK